MTKHDADKAPAKNANTPDDDETITEQPAKELHLTLSRSLYGKLLESAHDEGIAVEELAKEILTEGVSLRIWDILERRLRTREGEMLQANSQRQQQGGNNRNGNHKGGNHRGNHGNHGNHGNQGNQKNNRNERRQERYNNILNDGPTFLEYVRQLDKKR